MKKIYYFEINEEVIFCNSKKEILEAYLLKVPIEAIGDVPVISARVVERDFPRELCGTNRVLLGDVHMNNYWIEEAFPKSALNKLLKESLSEADIFYELYDEKEFKIKISLRACQYQSKKGGKSPSFFISILLSFFELKIFIIYSLKNGIKNTLFQKKLNEDFMMGI